jgi:hypothetical protein
VRAIWGSATAASEATEARAKDVPLKGPHKIHLKQTPTSKAG